MLVSNRRTFSKQAPVGGMPSLKCPAHRVYHSFQFLARELAIKRAHAKTGLLDTDGFVRSNVAPVIVNVWPRELPVIYVCKAYYSEQLKYSLLSYFRFGNSHLVNQ